jgi:hypothetical protein
MRSYRNSRYLGGKPSLLLTGVVTILEAFGAFLSWLGCQFRRVLAAQNTARVAREQARGKRKTNARRNSETME